MINWPDNPTFGQEHSQEGQTWEWDGVVWFIPPGQGGGGLPPIIPADQGKALVVNSAATPEWGAEIDNDSQKINGGNF